MTSSFCVVTSPIGPLRLGADASGRLHEVRIGVPSGRGEVGRLDEGESSSSARRTLADTAAQLEEYFAGKRKAFDLPLAMDGSAFQRQVWTELQEIPFGATVSYGQLATQIGRPGAARAVGHANARNPIAVIVPCHRVIGTSGQLTGYGGGLPAKQLLLELEALPPRNKSSVGSRGATAAL